MRRDNFTHHEHIPNQKPKFDIFVSRFNEEEYLDFLDNCTEKIVKQGRKKMKKATNRLFVMTRLQMAYTTKKCTLRFHKGPAYRSIKGWVINHWWCSGDAQNKAGINGRNMIGVLKKEYPEYFETISVKDFKKKYKPSRFFTMASEDLNRIKPDMRDKFNLRVAEEVKIYEDKNGEIKW